MILARDEGVALRTVEIEPGIDVDAPLGELLQHDQPPLVDGANEQHVDVLRRGRDPRQLRIVEKGF
jgi:hypothetical protein